MILLTFCFFAKSQFACLFGNHYFWPEITNSCSFSLLSYFCSTCEMCQCISVIKNRLLVKFCSHVTWGRRAHDKTTCITLCGDNLVTFLRPCLTSILRNDIRVMHVVFFGNDRIFFHASIAVRTVHLHFSNSTLSHISRCEIELIK